MQASGKRASWIFGLVAVGVTAAATLTLQTKRVPAQAQLSGVTGLSTAQLTRLQQLQGEFIRESGASGPALWKQVEAGTDGLDPAQARRTRAQLEQLLTAQPRVAFALEAGASGGSSLAIEEGRVLSSAPLSGDARALVPKGMRGDAEALRLSNQFQGTTLVRVVEGKGFRQERRFSLSSDGLRLTLEIRVSGAALPQPLSTTYVYKRL